MRIKAYRNLNDGSISLVNKGLVVGHAQKVVMSDAKFTVNERGRQRVLKDKQKNVHAYVIGELVEVEGFLPYKGREIDIDHDTKISSHEGVKVYYNPYKTDSFMAEDDKIKEAAKVYIASSGEMIAND